jgi:hypothetical protein
MAADGGKIYVSAFFVCERVDVAPNHNVTATNIASGVSIQTTAPQFPETNWTAPCYIRFTAEGEKKEFDVSVQSQDPAGTTATVLTQHVQVPPEPGGQVVVGNRITIRLKQVGLYWLDLLIDGDLVSRLPVTVTLRRMPPPGSRVQD